MASPTISTSNGEASSSKLASPPASPTNSVKSPKKSPKSSPTASLAPSALVTSPPLRSSFDGTPRSSTDHGERMSTLEQELALVRQEKEVLANQYRSLLGKLTAMRSSLGEKLREDAEELDRRENTITSLTSEISTLQGTVETLQTELANSNSEAANLQGQLTQLRSQSDSSSSDVLSLTREMRELRGEMERLRVEREEWESEAGKERERREGMEDDIRAMERREREARSLAERSEDEMRSERDRARSLQDVLSDFQAAKESEIRQATTELENSLKSAAASLSEWKLRAANAEAQLASEGVDAKRSKTLEKEMKEKNALISKLRHEAVVNNEHLTVALRRLRKSSSDNNVDRRLVTNILLSFLSTSRADSKRFEMLNLLSTILSWDDREREKAGLQKTTATPKGKMPAGPKRTDSEVKSAEEEAAMNESFSNLFVEFLLKEASQGQPIKPDGDHPLPSPGTREGMRSPSYATSPSPPGTGASTPALGMHQTRKSSMTSVSGSSTLGGLGSPTERPKLGLPVPSRKGSGSALLGTMSEEAK